MLDSEVPIAVTDLGGIDFICRAISQKVECASADTEVKRPVTEEVIDAEWLWGQFRMIGSENAGECCLRSTASSRGDNLTQIRERGVRLR
jgi:hypothetical protein